MADCNPNYFGKKIEKNMCTTNLQIIFTVVKPAELWSNCHSK